MNRRGEAADGPVTASRFCVSDLPQARRYEAWRESISCLFDVERTRTQAQNDDFRATMTSYRLGSMMLVQARTRAQLWRRSSSTIARDGMDHYMVQFYVAGTQYCDWSGGTVAMPSGGLLVYDLAREMSARSTDLSNMTLFLPRASLQGLLLRPDDQHMRTAPGCHPLTALFKDHLTALWRQAPSMSEGQARTLTQATAQLRAACLNAQNDSASARRISTDQALFGAVRRDIDRRLQDPLLGPDDLCRRHRLSRSRLYRMFEPCGGVAAYIRQRRLHAAMAVLVDPTQNQRAIGAVGEALGFSSSADFSRAFRQRYGLSPRAARHYGARSPSVAEAASLDRRYEQWLRTLAA